MMLYKRTISLIFVLLLCLLCSACAQHDTAQAIRNAQGTILASDHSFAAVHANGQVLSTETLPWKNIVSIMAGGGYILDIDKADAVHLAGQTAPWMDVVTHWTDVIVIDLDQRHIRGITSDGRLLWAGADGCTFAAENILAVDGTSTHFILLHSNGHITTHVCSCSDQAPPSVDWNVFDWARYAAAAD